MLVFDVNTFVAVNEGVWVVAHDREIVIIVDPPCEIGRTSFGPDFPVRMFLEGIVVCRPKIHCA